MSTKLEIPDNLPPLPPVPDGYDRWEYRGMGWCHPLAKYAICCDGESCWQGANDEPEKALGASCLHYIEAVKDEQLHAPGGPSEWEDNGEPIQPALEPGTFRLVGEPVKATGIEALVAADIAARQRVGVAKYGMTIEDNPLPLLGWLRHAYEECLDQAVYLRRAIAAIEGANEEKP